MNELYEWYVCMTILYVGLDCHPISSLPCLIHEHGRIVRDERRNGRVSIGLIVGC